MVNAASEKRFEDLVKAMIKVTDIMREAEKSTKKLKAKEKAERDLLFNNAKGVIVTTVTNLNNDPASLMQFAFELRKLDTTDAYSAEFLRGNLMPSTLVDVILSNHWNAALSSMVPSEDTFYRLVHGQYFLCHDASSRDSKP